MRIFNKYVLSGFASILLLYPSYKSLKHQLNEINKQKKNSDNNAQDIINLAKDWQNVYGDFNNAFSSLTSNNK